jgi:two-component sensor histidine kinase
VNDKPVENLFQRTLVSRELPIWVRYSITTLLVALAALVQLAGDFGRYPFLLFFPVIILSGVVFGRGTSFFATLLSATIAAYYFLSPESSLGVERAQDVVALVLFIAIGIATAVLIEALHRAHGELAEAHEHLHKTASDRAVLLRELSHRMRNDLAAVASLLAIQARALEDPAGQAALVAAGDRIQVLARVHQRLTMEEGAAVLDTKQFIADLCHDLRSSLVGFRPITISVSAESHPITLQRAVALGLMINELLTNALKHAFPDGSPGQVEVKFQKRSSEFCLAVHDNGVGLAGAVRGSGMGQELVRALAQGLGGRVSVEDAQPGLQMTITFPADPATSPAPIPT